MTNPPSNPDPANPTAPGAQHVIEVRTRADAFYAHYQIDGATATLIDEILAAAPDPSPATDVVVWLTKSTAGETDAGLVWDDEIRHVATGRLTGETANHWYLAQPGRGEAGRAPVALPKSGTRVFRRADATTPVGLGPLDTPTGGEVK